MAAARAAAEMATGCCCTPVSGAAPVVMSVDFSTTTSAEPRLSVEETIGREPRMKANSAALTRGCCSGRSRNHHQKMAHQSTPRPPKIQKACRHNTTGSPEDDMVWIIRASTAKEDKPPANRPAIHTVPCAKPRSSKGNQL